MSLGVGAKEAWFQILAAIYCVFWGKLLNLSWICFPIVKMEITTYEMNPTVRTISARWDRQSPKCLACKKSSINDSHYDYLAIILCSEQGWELRYSSILPLEPAYVRSSFTATGIPTRDSSYFLLLMVMNWPRTSMTSRHSWLSAYRTWEGEGMWASFPCYGRKKQNMGLVA